MSGEITEALEHLDNLIDWPVEEHVRARYDRTAWLAPTPGAALGSCAARHADTLRGPDAAHEDRKAFEIMAELCAEAQADHWINVRVKHIRALLRLRPAFAVLSPPTSAEPNDRAARVGDRSVHAEPISSLTHPETPESAEGGAS